MTEKEVDSLIKILKERQQNLSNRDVIKEIDAQVDGLKHLKEVKLIKFDITKLDDGFEVLKIDGCDKVQTLQDLFGNKEETKKRKIFCPYCGERLEE